MQKVLPRFTDRVRDQGIRRAMEGSKDAGERYPVYPNRSRNRVKHPYDRACRSMAEEGEGRIFHDAETDD